MTALAPGLDAPKTDGSCFNCGSHDHFAYTCPEPVRKEPYGAAVFRQRQADKTKHGSGGRGSDNSKTKGGGIVVTKYAPPPPPFPPPSFYPPPPPPPSASAWGQGGPYPPPAPGPPPNAYGQQPPQPYPPPNQAQPPYQPPYPPVNTGYGLPAPPPPHIIGGYAPPPPASAPPYNQYGQYGQPPYQPPPPPSSYGQPASYPPPVYPPTYAPPDRAYTPAPPQPSYQGSPAPGYQGPPAPGYQVPPPSGYQAPPVPPPPPPSFAPGYGVPPPAPGTYPPAPYAPNFQPPAPFTNSNPHKPNWIQDSGGHNNQRNRDRRDRRNDRDRGNKNKQHRRDNNNNNNNQRGRNHREDASSQRPSSTPRETNPKPSPAPTDVKTETPEVEATKAEEVKPILTVEEGDTKEDQFNQDELWDFEKAFIELETKAADPVGKPLAVEWNDIPTIPPAYNAKCIKSEYYDPDNPDAFLASVRDTKHWPALKRDPVFRFRRGMVAVQFPGSHHEYFTYHCSRRIGASELKERELVPIPSDETLIDPAKVRNSYPASVAHRHGDFPSISRNGKRNHPEADDYDRDVKRPRNKELDRSPLPRQTRRLSPQDVDVDTGSWAPQLGESRVDSPHRPYPRDEYSHSPGGYRLQANGRLVPYDSTQPPRHDSGYHSSSDRYRSGRDDKSSTQLSPPPSVRVRERDPSRERDRAWDRAREWTRDSVRRDRGRSASLTKTRTRSPSGSCSRSRSRTAADDSAAAGSADDMDDLEYELLGMQRPETPEKKVVYKPAIRRPRVKVNDAFSRRW